MPAMIASRARVVLHPLSTEVPAWGPNQIEGTNFETGMYVDFFIAQGKWDIRVVPCDKSVAAVKEIGLKVDGEFTYTISDKE